MNNSNSSGDYHKPLADINMVPLIDVMLVLLVIFMLAAPLSITGIQVQLPTSQAKGSQVGESKVVLSLNEKGDFYLGDDKVKESELVTKLSAIFNARSEKVIYIRADKKVAYGKVIDAMSAAKVAGISKIAMLTQPQTYNSNSNSNNNSNKNSSKKSK